MNGRFVRACVAVCLATGSAWAADKPLPPALVQELQQENPANFVDIQLDHSLSPEDNGPGPADQMGASVAMSGEWAAVGAPHDGLGSLINVGSVYVLKRIEGVWTHQVTLRPPAATVANWQLFGFRVALDGTTLLVGGGGSGKAHVYVFDGTAWTFQTTFTAPATGTGSFDSYALALHGDSAILSSGNSVHVFDRSGTTWTRTAQVPATLIDGDLFGYCAAFDGTTLVVGAPAHRATGVGQNSTGSVHVFTLAGGVWTETQIISGGGAFGAFGGAVAMSGDRLLVGVPKRRQAMVYSRTASTYTLEATLDRTDAVFPNEVGWSIALEDDMAILNGTVPVDGGSSYRVGSVAVWKCTAGIWTQGQKFSVPGQPLGPVAMQGNYLLLGMPVDTRQPAAYHYDGNLWQPGAVVMPADSDAEKGDNVGSAIAMSGDTLAIAAPGDKGPQQSSQASGRVDIYRKTGNAWSLEARILRPDSTVPVSFGHAIALDGETLLVGAPMSSSAYDYYSERAYVYHRAGGVWSLQGTLSQLPKVTVRSFGSAVALRGDLAFVGTDGLRMKKGDPIIRVFRRTGTAWKLESSITAVAKTHDMFMGSSGDIENAMALSFDGTRLAVGLAYEGYTGTGMASRSGGVCIYRRGGTGWVLESHIVSPASFVGEVGQSVCISGNTALLTAGDEVWIYALSGTRWGKQAGVNLPFGSYWSGQLTSLSLVGNLVLLGQTTDIRDFSFTPRVVPIIRRGQAWTPLPVPNALEGSNHSLFGSTLAQSASLAVIGAPNTGSELTALDGQGDARFVNLRQLPRLRVYEGAITDSLLHAPGATLMVGDIVADQTAYIDLVLANEGIGDLESLSFQLGGAHAGDFQVLLPDTTNLAPMKQRSYRLQVRAPASVTGNRQAVLTIQSSDPGQPAYALNLETNAVAVAVAPTVAPINADQIVTLGQPVLLSAVLGGTQPATFQWSKNGKAIAGATQPRFIIDSAALSHAGRYQLTVTNAAGKATSSAFRLAVVGTMAPTLQGFVDRTMIIRGPSLAGPDLGLSWFAQGTQLVEGAKYKDTKTTALSVSNALPTDDNSYTLHITLGTASYVAGPTTASVLVRPVITSPAITTWDVALPVDLLLATAPQATRFAATGLPPGVVLNTTTGRLSGRPTRPGLYHLNFSATNAAGTGPAVALDVEVLKLGDFTAGEYRGFIQRSSSCNGSHGSTLSVTLTGLGSATGSLTDGQGTRRFNTDFNRQIDGTTLGAEVSVTGQPEILLRMQIVPSTNTLTGTAEPVPNSLLGRESPPALVAYRNGWADSPATAPHAGSYVFTMKAGTPAANLPAGSGWATMVISTRGAVTWSGRTADGEAMLVSTFLAPDSRVNIHQMMASYRASILGAMALSSSGPITASFDWLRTAGLGRVYASGFPLHSLAVTGELYTPTTRAFMPGLGSSSPNATISFTNAGVDGFGTQIFIAKNGGVTIIPLDTGAKLTSLTFNTTKGTFTGSIKGVDPLNSWPAVSISGVVLPSQSIGAGYFLRPVVTTGQTWLTAPIISGSVVIQ